jgi:hypothetical protein
VRWEFRPLGRWDGLETDPRRSSAEFRASWPDTLACLNDELRHLEAAEPAVIQVDVDEADLRLDGMLRARARVTHPGVVISFGSRFGPLRYATDAYEQRWSGVMPGWQANARAIYLALVALRAVDRYGVSKRGEQYTGWRAIAAPAPMFASADEAVAWMRGYAAELFGPEGATRWNGSLGPLYRAMAKRMHPDLGGPRADWDRLDECRRVLAEAGAL